MRLGLVSDTHDNVALARIAAEVFRAEACDLVLHLGDVTSPATVDAFAGLPMRFLLGNNDDAAALAPALARHRFPPATETWVDRVGGVLVAAHHGHRPPALGDEAPGLLAHGHSHRRRCERVGRTLVVNPGALQRATVKTVAVADLPELRVRSCEVAPEGARRIP